MLNRVPVLARCHLMIESNIIGSPQHGSFVVSSRASPSARAALAPMLRLTELMSRRLITSVGEGNCSIGPLSGIDKTINSTFLQPKVIATTTTSLKYQISNILVRTLTRGPIGMSDTTESGFQQPLPIVDLNPVEMQEYNRAISDLNSLQSNTQVLALAKYKQPETILPLFHKQMRLAGIEPDQLNKLNAIHVSGTKGKGSTCAFLESILLQQSPKALKVGSYNSPHLIHVTERIRLDGQPIGRALFTKYFRHVFDTLKLATQREQVAMPSYFAFLTILAFHIFLKERVDCAIVEVGIGGEYDPTNVLPAPVACAITTLDLDHTNILGNTIRSIAWTKAGIIKPRAPLFTIEHEQPEALESIRTRALERGSPVVICKPLETLEKQKHQLGIKGPAQTLNASLACQLASYFLSAKRSPENQQTSEGIHLEWKDLPESFAEGLRRACLPGRCQIIKCPDAATFFLDGAHTKKSMENCLDWFTQASGEMDESATRVLMVNVIGERNKSQVLEPLIKFSHLFDKIIFTSNKVHATVASESSSSCDNFSGLQDVANHERSFENVKNNARAWADLTGDCDTDTRVVITPSIMQSLDALDPGKKSLHVLATGSLHFVGAMMEALEIRYPNKANNLH